MISIDELVQKEIKRGEDLKALLEDYRTRCPAILAVLEAHSMTAYKYFDVNLSSLNSVNNFVHCMYHAMIDDGDYSVVRTENKDISEMHKRVAEFKAEQEGKDPETVTYTKAYNYKVICGDAGGIDSPVYYLREEDVIEICRLDRLHYDYYEANSEAIEDRTKPFGTGEEHKEYWRLARLADQYLEQKWTEAYEHNKDYYERNGFVL